MAKQEEVLVRVTAEIAGLKSDMEQAKKAIASFEEKVDKAGGATNALSVKTGKLGAAAKGVGAVIGALSAAVGVLVKQQLEAARASSLWASRLNVARSSFSQLAAVGAKFGATTDDVGDAIKDLNERIADAAAGNKNYEDLLNRVGLKSKELMNLPVDEQFLKVADAIGKMNNAGDKNLVTAELMADAGFRLIPMFEKGETAIRRMGDELIRTNQALSETQIQKLEQVNKATREMGLAVEALGNSLAIHLAPGLKLAAQWAEKLSGIASDLLGTSETAMRDRLVEINAELKKYKNVGTILKEQTKSRGGSVALYNKHVLEKISLMQEMVQIENDLRSFEESSLKMTNKRTSAVDAETEAMDARNEALTTALALNAAFEEQLSQAGPTLATMGSMGLTGGTGGTVGPMQGPEVEQDKMVKDLLLQNLLDYQENEWEYKNAQRERELEANRGFWDSMLMIDEKAKNANAALWESGWQGKMNVASKFMGQMSTLMDTNSRKQFEIGKAAAIAQVAIDTPKAAMSAYSAMAGIPYIGPALGIAAAAAAVASGASQIQNIKSQTMGGGSSGGGGGIVGASGISGGGGAQQAAPENVLDATFNIQGSSVSADSVRQLGSSLNEYIEDGFRIRSVQVV